MIRFRYALMASAIALSLGLSLAAAQAQGGPPGTTQGYGRGYGPGMMGGGYGPGMMNGYDSGSGPEMMWGGGYGPGAMWGWGGVPRRGDASTTASLAEGRLAFLKAELKITAPQEKAWNEYAQTVRKTTKALYEQHQLYFDHVQSDESLPQRLDEREEVMATAFDAMRKTDAALKPLYAALGADQKAVADQVLGVAMMPGVGMF